ncbi:hypothetical protein LIQ91_00960 [Ruminococcus callidus]|nr:hypothetical protein [Ruminococcus callidus]MCB5774288.1 hypothetical protein [Ruminococcus callidus]
MKFCFPIQDGRKWQATLEQCPCRICLQQILRAASMGMAHGFPKRQ